MKTRTAVRLTAAVSAAVLSLSSVPVSASETPMTLRLYAEPSAYTEDARVSVDELAENGGLISGALFIDSYTGISEIMLMLKSDDPLTIVNGGFAEPAYFAASSTARFYPTRESDGAPLNSVLWYGPENADAYYDTGVVNDPSLPFLRFDVSIPQDTAPGTYKLYIAEGQTVNSVGQIEKDFFIYNGDDVPEVTFLPAAVTVEPALLRGDCNNDGHVTLNDAIAVLSYNNYLMMEMTVSNADLEELFGTPYVYGAVKQSDVNRSGDVTLDDAISIITYYNYTVADLDPDWDTDICPPQT